VAFEPDTQMHDFGAAGLPTDGVLLGASAQQLLDVGVGDEVSLTRTDGAASMTAPVIGFVDEPLGTFVYASIDEVAPLDGARSTSLLVSFDDGVDRDAMRTELSALPGVAAYSDARSLYETARGMMSLFFAFVGVMLVFGSLMAVALIVNTATVNAAERSPSSRRWRSTGPHPGSSVDCSPVRACCSPAVDRPGAGGRVLRLGRADGQLQQRPVRLRARAARHDDDVDGAGDPGRVGHRAVASVAHDPLARRRARVGRRPSSPGSRPSGGADRAEWTGTTTSMGAVAGAQADGPATSITRPGAPGPAATTLDAGP
jgi:hypothetical protein